MRPGQKVHKTPGPDFGVKVIEPGFPSAAGGWWDDFGAIGCCVGAYQGRNAADYASSLVNLANPGVNDLTEIGGGPPGWNAVQGWFNFGVLARCLDTGLNPTPGTWSMLVQFTNANNGAMMGCTGAGATRFFIQPFWAGGGQHIYAIGVTFGFVPIVVNGNMGLAGAGGYLNGIWEGNSGFTGGPPGLPIYIGALNAAGVPGSWMAGEVQAVGVYNCTLTAPQMAAVAANMAAI